MLGLRQSGIPTLRYSDLQLHAAWVEQAIEFGAKWVDRQAGQASESGGVSIEALDALVDRWAFDKKDVLASG